MVRKWLVLLPGLLALSACGSSAVQSAQGNKNVQQTEAKVEQQVVKCLPSANGVPDPLLLARSGQRAKFATCTGVAKHIGSFDKCAVKVVLGGLPTRARLEKGLAVCVQQNA